LCYSLQKAFAVLCFLFVADFLVAQNITIGNEIIIRTLKFDGKVWRTSDLVNKKNKDSIHVTSEEFHILPMNGNKGLTISDFTVTGKPVVTNKADTQMVVINYKPLKTALTNPACPQQVSICYYAVKNQPFLRKKMQLHYDKPATVDRLEVERFVATEKQSGGGRGEPVFIGNSWYVGLEYPAGYSRHTDGNTPMNYSRTYDATGNYSYIDLESRDVDHNAVKGMIRLMHFPGYTVKAGNGYEINSKSSVIGCNENGQSIKSAFMQYLTGIWKPSRPFLNYNNWFDQSAKDLSGDNFVNAFLRYKTVLDQYGIKLDGMIPDDGWQEKNSIWQPLGKYFPKGDTDLVLLSNKLKQAGTRLGLWMSLNSYNNNIKWGKDHGYEQATPNLYFRKYNSYYSLSGTNYKAAILKRVPELAKKADLIYYKHDFNDFSDIAEGNNHPPTDRHGHEANVDAAIEILTATRKAQPEILQNLTNWVWMSPWWLQYADYLWMLAGDDGENGNTPELSLKAMSTTDRDTYLWRLFGNQNDRPLVPVSRLMTHGVLQRGGDDMTISLEEWMDYVLMFYGRGTLLQEWYITLNAMNDERWKALASIHNWSTEHRSILNNMFFVGQRPDEGNVYGYIGWDGDKGVLVTRNPSAHTQKLKVPFDERTGFAGTRKTAFVANVVYPYREQYPVNFESGSDIEIEVPGYSTLAFELQSGRVDAKQNVEQSEIVFSTTKSNGNKVVTQLSVPGDAQGRCELLLIGYPQLPVITIDDKVIQPKQQSKAKLNNFAGYAKSGMCSTKASDWNMAMYDLMPYRGKQITIQYVAHGKFESHFLVERKVNERSGEPASLNEILPIKNNVRRQTIQLY